MHKSNFLPILLASSMFRNRLNRIGWKNFIQWLSCDAANRNCMRTLHSTAYTRIHTHRWPPRWYWCYCLSLLLARLCVYASERERTNDPAKHTSSTTAATAAFYMMLYNITMLNGVSVQAASEITVVLHTARAERSRQTERFTHSHIHTFTHSLALYCARWMTKPADSSTVHTVSWCLCTL